MWWFRPTCPIAAERKEWIEYRMSWLAGQVGLERIKAGPVILPTEEFFPDLFEGSDEAIRALLDRVCEYMGFDPATVAMDLYSEHRHTDLSPGFSVESEGPGSAGLYYERAEKTIVALEESNREDPASLVATMAHELCHAYLLGGGRVAREESDQEPLTDLTTVCFGLGLMVANAVIRESRWSRGGWSGWSIGRKGYLTENDLAYALAVYAWARGERKPPWARHLRLNVRSLFSQSLQYIL
ncbi:MAG: hypothetical protein ISS78_10080, partial [Phycisphaerae bacterium]|nr:hypothetical protein [Phycisphaerae bacterium]